MATTPTFASNPRSLDRGAVTVANTARDGTGTIVTIATGSAAGLRVDRVVAQAIVSTTAGMIRLFLSTDSGVTWKLFDELPVGAATASGSVAAARSARAYPDMVLFGTSNRLGASTNNAEAHEVWVLGADL